MKGMLVKVAIVCGAITLLSGCSNSNNDENKDKEDETPSFWSKLDINELDFVLDLINPDVETLEDKKAIANRPYEIDEEDKAMKELVSERKVDMMLYDYENLVEKHIRHLSSGNKRITMQEYIAVLKENEEITNAEFDTYSYEVYALVHKYKTPSKVLNLKDIKGKKYLTDLFDKTRKNHMLLLKKDYIDEYKVEVNYKYVLKKYGRFMDKDLKKAINNKYYKSLQYNNPS